MESFFSGCCVIKATFIDPVPRRFLTVGRTYQVIEINGDWLRVVNDAGEPILYEMALFRLLDQAIPGTWHDDCDQTGFYAGPAEFAEPGLYEDYFDGVPETVEKFEAYRRREGWPPRVVVSNATH
ncbi:hypothetical protein [Chitiniphilus shinanonensis]|uniref:hypothetical protein n=1 Tax=Chitiniphilus shinanonensis TaxID=553088 RepID=UPI003052BF4E